MLDLEKNLSFVSEYIHYFNWMLLPADASDRVEVITEPVSLNKGCP